MTELILWYIGIGLVNIFIAKLSGYFKRVLSDARGLAKDNLSTNDLENGIILVMLFLWPITLVGNIHHWASYK